MRSNWHQVLQLTFIPQGHQGLIQLDVLRCWPFFKGDFLKSNSTRIWIRDLVVFWSRSGGIWGSEGRFAWLNMNPKDHDFPYGLVFEHVAVRVSPTLVFTRRTRSLNTKYKFDFLETAKATLRFAFGLRSRFIGQITTAPA